MKHPWIVLLIVGLTSATALLASPEAAETATTAEPIPEPELAVTAAVTEADDVAGECQPLGGFVDEDTLGDRSLSLLTAVELAELGLGESPLGADVVYASSCNVSLSCGDGNVASCSGNNYCQKNTGECFVNCDGNKQYCPNTCFVSANCTGTSWVFCRSCSGDCQQGQGSVTCDGHTYQCPPDREPRQDF